MIAILGLIAATDVHVEHLITEIHTIHGVLTAKHIILGEVIIIVLTILIAIIAITTMVVVDMDTILIAMQVMVILLTIARQAGEMEIAIQQ